MARREAVKVLSMKISAAAADRFVAKPDAKIRAILVYGPDEGLVAERGKKAAQAVCPDLAEFSRFAREVLLNLPNVKDLHTSFSLGEVKAAGALPLAHLMPTGASATAVAVVNKKNA